MADSKSKGPAYLSKPLVHRIGRAVKRVEHTHGIPPDQRSGRSYVPFLPIQPALVTTAIPTGSVAGTVITPSTSGRVTIYRDDGAGGLFAAETGAECRNVHTLSASIAVGKVVQVTWRAGVWHLVSADC